MRPMFHTDETGVLMTCCDTVHSPWFEWEPTGAVRAEWRCNRCNVVYAQVVGQVVATRAQKVPHSWKEGGYGKEGRDARSNRRTDGQEVHGQRSGPEGS